MEELLVSVVLEQNCKAAGYGSRLHSEASEGPPLRSAH